MILDVDLAKLYGVETKAFNRAVKRNLARFPGDFMFFQLNREEFNHLRCQQGSSKSDWVGRRYLPYAFTEHGAIMAANILRSDNAIQMSVHVVRAFTQLREIVSGSKRLSEKVAEIESRLDDHDEAMQELIEALKFLLDNPPPPEPKRRIGFTSELEE